MGALGCLPGKLVSAYEALLWDSRSCWVDEIAFTSNWTLGFAWNSDYVTASTLLLLLSYHYHGQNLFDFTSEDTKKKLVVSSSTSFIFYHIKRKK